MITIDYHDRRPIYQQLVDRYEKLIISGAMAPGEQLPSVRQLAQELSINPNTIQKALAILESDGYIYPVKGRGNFVSDSRGAADARRQQWQQELRTLLLEGKDLGVGRQACIETIEEVYGEGEAQC